MSPYLVGEGQARQSKLRRHLCAQGEPVDRTLTWLSLVSSDLRAIRILISQVSH
jgi:hypothetical protein